MGRNVIQNWLIYQKLGTSLGYPDFLCCESFFLCQAKAWQKSKRFHVFGYTILSIFLVSQEYFFFYSEILKELNHTVPRSSTSTTSFLPNLCNCKVNLGNTAVLCVLYAEVCVGSGYEWWMIGWWVRIDVSCSGSTVQICWYQSRTRQWPTMFTCFWSVFPSMGVAWLQKGQQDEECDLSSLTRFPQWLAIER